MSSQAQPPPKGTTQWWKSACFAVSKPRQKTLSKRDGYLTSPSPSSRTPRTIPPDTMPRRVRHASNVSKNISTYHPKLLHADIRSPAPTSPVSPESATTTPATPNHTPGQGCPQG